LFRYAEPEKEAAKSKLKKTSRINLNSLKHWNDTDHDVPQFATMDEFEIAKAFVLKVTFQFVL